MPESTSTVACSPIRRCHSHVPVANGSVERPSEHGAGCSKYADKVTLVTGGSRGIGEGIVRVFAREGSSVCMCAPASAAAQAEALIQDIRKQHPNASVSFIPADVTKQVDLDQLARETIRLHGRLDCLVNNVGWHPPPKPIDDMSLLDFRALLEINLISAWYLTHLLIKELRKTRGNIINMSSIAGHFGQAGSATYSATKAALVGMTKSLAIDEAKYGVRVNAVSPSNIWTPLWEEHVSHLPDKDDVVRAGAASQVLGRMGTIVETGEVCLHLATAPFTTGIEYLHTGGAELGYGHKAHASYHS